jgi:CRP-like cAMP-binding protein
MPLQTTPARSPLRITLESLGIPPITRICRRGATLYSQADICDSVLYVESGRVRLSVMESGGREAIVGLCGKGAFLGEEALAGFANRRATAIAITRTTALVIPKAVMLRLIRTVPVVRDQFVAHLLARHKALETNLSDQLLHTCEQRLARTLLELAGCTDECGASCALPDVSQTVIAEMVGTTRSHVNMFMQKFRSLGLITDRDGIVYVMPSLVAFAHRAESVAVRHRERQHEQPRRSDAVANSPSAKPPDQSEDPLDPVTSSDDCLQSDSHFRAA